MKTEDPIELDAIFKLELREAAKKISPTRKLTPSSPFLSRSLPNTSRLLFIHHRSLRFDPRRLVFKKRSYPVAIFPYIRGSYIYTYTDISFE